MKAASGSHRKLNSAADDVFPTPEEWHFPLNEGVLWMWAQSEIKNWFTIDVSAHNKNVPNIVQNLRICFCCQCNIGQRTNSNNADLFRILSRQTQINIEFFNISSVFCSIFTCIIRSRIIWTAFVGWIISLTSGKFGSHTSISHIPLSPWKASLSNSASNIGPTDPLWIDIYNSMKYIVSNLC